MLGNVAAITVASTSMLAVLLQVAEPLSDTGLDKISRLGATGLLALAVIVLWRKVQEKDAVLMANYRMMAESLASNKAVNDKMAETLEAIKDAVERLETVRSQLGYRETPGG